jgi:hypothetical protein
MNFICMVLSLPSSCCLRTNRCILVNTRTGVHAYEHLPEAVKRRWRPRIVQEGQEGEMGDRYPLQTIHSTV